MVITRSKKNHLLIENENIEEIEEEDIPNKKIKNKKKYPSIKILFSGQKKSSKNKILQDDKLSDNEDKLSDDESTLSDNIEDEYLDFISDRIKNDPKKLEIIKELISEIENETITIDKLLESEIRKKYKAEIFEWIMIYQNSMPLSEERKILRKQINNLYTTYTKEFIEYQNFKDQINELEKKSKDFHQLHDIQYNILKLQTDFNNKETIYRKYLELTDKSEELDEEFYKLKNWIHNALQLPYDRVKSFPSYVNITDYLLKIQDIFNKELYGMTKVKEQLLLFIHGKLMNPEMKGCCLGLVGEPGVGKTSIARCLARVMEFPFEQITFGGVNSAEFIRGFDYTYVGSRPGEIVRCLSRMGYKNGILFFDEYEKISQNRDISACLLHLTDFTQNNNFRDNYLHDIRIDLSCIWFIYSMNNLPEDEALKDRIFYIHVDGYKEDEKIRILCDYLLPKHLKNLNLKSNDIIIPDIVAQYMIRKVCPSENGIRTMEKYLKDLLNKLSFLVSNQSNIQCSFSIPSKYFPLDFPIIVNNEMIDILLKNSISNNSKYLFMYS